MSNIYHFQVQAVPRVLNNSIRTYVELFEKMNSLRFLRKMNIKNYSVYTCI